MSGMSNGTHDIDLDHWALLCKDLYCLVDDELPGSATIAGEELCVSDFDSKFEKLNNSTPSPLNFLSGKGRLDRKMLRKNDTAEYRL
jgi:hypothetical protein